MVDRWTGGSVAALEKTRWYLFQILTFKVQILQRNGFHQVFWSNIHRMAAAHDNDTLEIKGLLTAIQWDTTQFLDPLTSHWSARNYSFKYLLKVLHGGIKLEFT